MAEKCSNPDCPAPPHCHEGKDDYTKCEFWIENNTEIKESKHNVKKRSKTTSIPWTGEPFTIEDIPQISRRNIPIFLGIVGSAGAGKTTFLAMLYTLLLNGRKLKQYTFSGTKTILGWDNLHYRLKVLKGKVSFPDTTPSGYTRLWHLALRNSENQLKDIFLNDTSGEVFSLWSLNKDDINAENARWVYTHANGFILFIDCEDLIERKNSAKYEVIDIAQMLRHDLRDRPVIAVWSKADKKEQIHPKIKSSLKVELQSLFTNYSEIDISNFSSDEPDELVHENNLKVIDWLLNKLIVPCGKELIIDIEYNDDLFLNYRGK